MSSNPVIEELQIKVAYLENIHEELNQVVVELQKENMRLRDELNEIKEHIKNSSASSANSETNLFDQLAQEKPPHY